MNYNKLSIISFVISLLLLLTQGNDKPEFVDSDNCVFMFLTYGYKEGSEQKSAGVEIKINKRNSDTEETSEDFSIGWYANYNDEDFSGGDGGYDITDIELDFHGPFDLSKMEIYCGNDINVGRKGTLSMDKALFEIGNEQFSTKVDYIKIYSSAWNCNGVRSCLRSNMYIRSK